MLLSYDDNDDADEYTNLCLCISLLLAAFYSYIPHFPSSFSFLPYLTIPLSSSPSHIGHLFQKLKIEDARDQLAALNQQSGKKGGVGESKGAMGPSNTIVNRNIDVSKEKSSSTSTSSNTRGNDIDHHKSDDPIPPVSDYIPPPLMGSEGDVLKVSSRSSPNEQYVNNI